MPYGSFINRTSMHCAIKMPPRQMANYTTIYPSRCRCYCEVKSVVCEKKKKYANANHTKKWRNYEKRITSSKAHHIDYTNSHTQYTLTLSFSLSSISIHSLYHSHSHSLQRETEKGVPNAKGNLFTFCLIPMSCMPLFINFRTWHFQKSQSCFAYGSVPILSSSINLFNLYD